MDRLVLGKHPLYLPLPNNYLGNLRIKYFSPDIYRDRILELNASDDRGISVIREKVKSFAMVSVQGHADGYPCPPIKFVILDEADSLTSDAQSALRRTMEIFSKNTRFCIICNYICRLFFRFTSES